jgi:hypothetical protein
MRREFGQIINCPRTNRDRDRVVALERLQQFFDELVLCIQIRLGVYERLQALPIPLKRIMHSPASRLKSVCVGYNYRRLISKLLSKDFRRFIQKFGSDLERASVFGRRQSFGELGPFRG